MLPGSSSRWIISSFLVGGALICAGSSLAKGPSKPPPPPVSRPISFQTKSSYDIRLSDQGGSSLVTVQTGVAPGGWPRWSPDGSLIGGYFKVLSDASGHIVERRIMAMSPDGSGEFIVITSAEFDAWNLSRPGIQGSFLPNLRYYLNNPSCWLDNGAMVFGGYADYDASFFGQADPSYDTNGLRLFVVDALGDITPLTEVAIQNAGSEGAYDDFDPHWSPILNAVVFVSNRSGFPELYAIAPDGTGLQQITDFGGTTQLYGPVWNPAGDRIVVTVGPGASQPTDLWILDVDLNQPNPGSGAGGRLTAIDPFEAQGNGVYEETAAWSPTGDDIVFTRYWSTGGQNGTFQIVIADTITAAESIVLQSSTKGRTIRPDWKPVP